MADGQDLTTIEPKGEVAGLDLLRQPFPPNCISKLPKPTAAQTKAVKDDFKQGIRCDICGSWHHPKVVHLDYVGHAALTDRLLDADPEWTWEPVVMEGLPNPGAGMWIKLTVCGVSRLGYGSADGKSGGDAIKEIIGDALRNAAMRFGAALDLWHKGDLHGAPDGDDEAPANDAEKAPAAKGPSRDLFAELQKQMRECSSSAELQAWGAGNSARLKTLPKDWYGEIKTEYAKELDAFITLENSEQESLNGHAA